MTDTCILRSAVPGCPNGMSVPLEHLSNLLAAGWRCPASQDQEEAR